MDLKRVIGGASALFLVVLAFLVTFGHDPTRLAGADYPVPQGPAAGCDGGSSPICGSYPAALRLNLGNKTSGGILGKLPIADLSTDGGVDGGVPTNVAGAIQWKASSGGSGAVSSVTGSAPISCSPTTGSVVCSLSGSDVNSSGHVVSAGGGLVDFTGTLGSATTQISTVYNSLGMSLNQIDPTTDVAPSSVSISASDAWSGASTHINGGTLQLFGGDATSSATGGVGGDIVLISGAGSTTNGTGGSVSVYGSAPTGTGSESSLSFWRGVPGAAVTQFLTRKSIGIPFGLNGGAIWLGGNNAGTPSNTNFFAACDDSGDGYCEINGPSDGLSLAVGSTTSQILTGSGVGFFESIAPSLGGGAGVIGIGPATTNPTSSSTGAVLYADHTTGDFAVKAPGGTSAALDVGAALITNSDATSLGYATVTIANCNGGTTTLTQTQSNATLLKLICTAGTTANTIQSLNPPTAGTIVIVKMPAGPSVGATFKFSSGGTSSGLPSGGSAIIAADGANPQIIMNGT